MTARAHRGEMVLESATMKEVFLQILKRAKAKFHFRLENLCVMNNHFHMIIEPGPKGNLSRIMQWILSGFAVKWNRIHGWTGQGSVWGQRFFSRVLSSLAQYLHTFFYIDANPVVAGLVAAPSHWSHGRHGLNRPGEPALVDDPPDDWFPLDLR